VDARPFDDDSRPSHDLTTWAITASIPSMPPNTPDGVQCESPELTDFLRSRARKEMEALVSACFVLVSLDDPGRIAGYYRLSAAEVVTATRPWCESKLMRRLTVMAGKPPASQEI